jgi:hypothetical protein
MPFPYLLNLLRAFADKIGDIHEKSIYMLYNFLLPLPSSGPLWGGGKDR